MNVDNLQDWLDCADSQATAAFWAMSNNTHLVDSFKESARSWAQFALDHKFPMQKSKTELELLKEEIEKKDYIGDGVYVRFDGYHVVMTTEDGISAYNTIALEDSVIESFERYIVRIRTMITEYRTKSDYRT